MLGIYRLTTLIIDAYVLAAVPRSGRVIGLARCYPATSSPPPAPQNGSCSSSDMMEDTGQYSGKRTVHQPDAGRESHTGLQ